MRGSDQDRKIDDQIVPIPDSALLLGNLGKKRTLNGYPGLPCTTHPEVINRDFLAFIKS